MNKKYPIDEFYQTEYTFSLANNISLFYNNNYYHFICINCNKKHVEIKKEIIDFKQPFFAIFRKKYCISCWLEIFNAKYNN